MDSQDPAIFILIAQSHLNDRLSRTILESFNQRINLKFHFRQLNLKESTGYIKHHLKITGASVDILDENALTAVYNLTGGVIRKINQLVIKALCIGALIKKHVITEEEVLGASKEL